MNAPFHRADLYASLRSGLAELGLAPPVDAIERMLDYVELLSRWNTAYNLTAVRDPSEMVTRHVLDSLSVTPFVTGESLVDVGSGAGLPGIPLAILAPEREILLIDSNGKKASFLREAARTLGLARVRVEAQRVEKVRGQFDCVTARAFASLSEMLTLGGHLLAPGGVWLALKGVLKTDEIKALPPQFRVDDVKALNVPGLGAARHVVIIKHAAAVMARENAA